MLEAPILPDGTLNLLVESIRLFIPEGPKRIQLLCVIDPSTHALIGAVGFQNGVPLPVEQVQTASIVKASIAIANGARIVDANVSSIIVQYEGNDLVIQPKPNAYVSILLHREPTS